MILKKINNPSDLKNLTLAERNQLADEMREILVHKIDTTGGHVGPNLGFLEATIALHTVFNSPQDKIVFDVSHQCYAHKMLTGRKKYFMDESLYEEISGFTAPKESVHDLFQIGHTSTGVSLATGLAKARDLRHQKFNVVAVVGDGSLTGGEALEGLDNASVLGSNIIIIVNDNEMSIAENHGGLYQNLRLLRETNGMAENNFFKAMGFEYHYVANGNNIADLTEMFEKVKDTEVPVIIHIHTLKGHGLKVAEENKEIFHWIMPGMVTQMQHPSSTPAVHSPDYTSLTVDWLLQQKKTDSTVIAVTAGTPGATGFSPDFRKEMGAQFLDVGICEQHAVATVSGMAKGGAKPVFAVLSSFIQRSYDQLAQDLALNNSPATILVYWGGLSGMDATHVGAFDIPLIANIPNMIYLAPTNAEEYRAMLDWSAKQTQHSVAIRVPFGPFITTGIPDTTDYDILNRYQVVEEGSQVALIGVGNFFERARAVKDLLKEKAGISATLINPKFLTGVDTDLLNSLKKTHQLVITLEDGVLDGGFGEKVARFYGASDMKVLCFGGQKEFTDRVPLDELYIRYHLTPELIVEDIQTVLKGA